MGYSDCTNLHLFFWNLGIISYYGGAVMNQFAMGGKMHEYTVLSIKKAIFSPSIGEVQAAPEWTDADLDWADKRNLSIKRPMHKGEGWHWHNNQNQVIKGQLWGGCLEVLNLHLSVRRYCQVSISLMAPSFISKHPKSCLRKDSSIALLPR